MRRAAAGRAGVAVASLLLAVVLLVTAGALNLYLNTTIRVAGDVQPYDIRVQGYSSTEDGSDQFAQDMLDDFATLYATLSDFEGVEAAGSSASLSVPVSIPSSIVGDRVAEGLDSALEMNDGTVETQATLVFVDDESYRAFLEQEGLDPQTYMDPAHPRALRNDQVLGNDGSTYQVMDMFVSAGSIQVYAYENREGWYRSGEYLLPNGQMGVAYQKDDGTSMDVAREDGAQPAYTLEIGAVTDEAPAVVGRSSWMPVVMVPQSFASVLGMSDSEASEATGLVFSAAFNAEDHAAAAKDMEAFLDGNTSFGTNVYDAAAEQEQTEMLATVVETFSLCFAGILTLIAVANVFNTLVNSLVLRRREFAVLKSVGMGNKAFNRMIAWECVRYGIRGLGGRPDRVRGGDLPAVRRDGDVHFGTDVHAALGAHGHRRAGGDSGHRGKHGLRPAPQPRQQRGGGLAHRRAVSERLAPRGNPPGRQRMPSARGAAFQHQLHRGADSQRAFHFHARVRAEIAPHAVVHVLDRDPHASRRFGMQDVLARMLAHAYAVVGHAHDDVFALHLSDDGDGQLAFRRHGMPHGVFHQRLDEERRDEKIFHLWLYVHFHAPRGLPRTARSRTRSSAKSARSRGRTG